MLSVSLCLSLSVCLSPSLCPSHSLLCLSLSLPLPLSVSPSLSLPLSFPPFLCYSIALSQFCCSFLYHLSLSLSLPLSLSLSCSLSLSGRCFISEIYMNVFSGQSESSRPFPPDYGAHYASCNVSIQPWIRCTGYPLRFGGPRPVWKLRGLCPTHLHMT